MSGVYRMSKARKDGKCQECGGIIRKGEMQVVYSDVIHVRRCGFGSRKGHYKREYIYKRWHPECFQKLGIAANLGRAKE
jgi:hypothetical protein